MSVAFIAGATGYTGRALLAELQRGAPSWRARPHACAPGKLPESDAVICDPLDVGALSQGMRGADAVVQLIGVTRKQFPLGMTYEKIDYGTTVALGEAAREAGVQRFLLLSSALAGTAVGHYLRVKRQTEQWLERSGLTYTIFRPSMIVGPGRPRPPVLASLIQPFPIMRAIDVGDLARIMVHALERRDEVANRILEGKSLWALLPVLIAPPAPDRG